MSSPCRLRRAAEKEIICADNCYRAAFGENRKNPCLPRNNRESGESPLRSRHCERESAKHRYVTETGCTVSGRRFGGKDLKPGELPVWYKSDSYGRWEPA